MDKDILLNNYFEGILSEKEKQQFDELLANDSEFKTEFEFQKKAKVAVALSERQKLKNQLKEIENSRKLKNNNKTWLSIAASIVVVLSLGFIFFWNSSTTNDDLYADFYETFPNIEAPTTRGENNLNIKSEAFYAYDSKDYKKATELFSEIYKVEKTDYAIFYIGLSEMELNEHKKAINTFSLFEGDSNNNFYYYVKWYKALCYLKENDIENSKKLLNEVVKTVNPFQSKSKELLSKLD
ncbi:tetratricopeptide repeat protein [Flavobacterium channae]|uniref:tetratricopeptide repeat protein n=1 Tax=Flavobacterium channae TaxID=2897181 RepID=UPI001E290EDC|nr:hypothetical protein [Flavobacterium channae]UGS22901.1 hypothetical protein LOS89_08960 [Flavobacterium channae]